jgi:hypothetical protein
MTRSVTPSPQRQRGRGGVVAVATILTAAFTLPALAAETGPFFSKRRDRDVTIIIIDGDDRQQKRFVPESGRKPEAATTLKRRDDDIRIRLPRKSHGAIVTGGGASVHGSSGIVSSGGISSGHKVIIVDGNSPACKGTGVCVIRP